MSKSVIALIVGLLGPAVAQAGIFVSQQPVSGGGVVRWSKLWVDPSPAGNNLDGDAICYEDFVLTQATPINHIEWWGKPDAPGYAGQPNLGFQIEFWKQDPGTIAYQPLGVFRESGAQPHAAFTTTSYTTTAGPGGLDHFTLDLANAVTLPANDATNPRWFIAIIGLTDVAYLEWDWAQGTGGSTKTFQFIRGGSLAGGDYFTSLPEGRALVLGTSIPEPAAVGLLAMGVLTLARRRQR